jgi:hypothetical protein
VIGKENIFTNHHLQSFKEEGDKVLPVLLIIHLMNSFMKKTGDV